MGETNVTDGSAVVEGTEQRQGSKENKDRDQPTKAAGRSDAATPRSPRAKRTREAVVDALLALLDEGNLRPTAREVADRANVSLRSVYVHFDDVDALFLAAAIRHGARVEEARGEVTTTGSFEERLEAFVERRARTLEVNPNVRRAALLQEPFSPAIRDVLTIVRQLLVSELDEVFAPELAAVEPEVRAFQRSALTVVLSAPAWDNMRMRDQCSVEDAKRIVTGLVRLIFQGGAEAGVGR